MMAMCMRGGYLETLLAAHPGRLLQIAEICGTTGTSAFILKRCCWNALGMSPGRYLSLRRLKLVRLALQNADPATTAVVEVLRECGYSASQRYVAEYRSVFGSVPFTNLGSAGARRFGIGGDGAFPA